MAYHHGSAREALLAAATALLEQEGAAGLSLRQLAERAELSRQAPYNHFADKEALLAELARRGFAALKRSIDDATAAAGVLGRLAAAGEAYIAFGQGQPALFRLMFSRELVDIDKFPAAREAAGAARASLVAVIADIVAPAAVADAGLAAWCLVHGYTSLCIEAGLESDALRRDRAALFARMIIAAAA